MKEQKLKMLSVDLLEVNTGQIENVPSNPRLINEERMAALKKSISELPDMLALRELIVYPVDGKYVILCGNMRYEACVELGFTEVPCKVLSSETPSEVMRRIVMVDNEEFGKTDWDKIAVEWDVEELREWGIEVTNALTDNWDELPYIEEEQPEPVLNKPIKIVVVIPYEQSELENEIRNVLKEATLSYSGVQVQ